ncbi:hypothetical protein Syun_009901 [Stephania yunnanensis]|uniref:Uncharacterized protein n=1 Tax=Stephania yunnanensis TaxID=152371 RepID=A0AAP0KHV4_9MAGN
MKCTLNLFKFLILICHLWITSGVYDTQMPSQHILPPSPHDISLVNPCNAFHLHHFKNVSTKDATGFKFSTISIKVLPNCSILNCVRELLAVPILDTTFLDIELLNTGNR